MVASCKGLHYSRPAALNRNDARNALKTWWMPLFRIIPAASNRSVVPRTNCLDTAGLIEQGFSRELDFSARCTRTTGSHGIYCRPSGRSNRPTGRNLGRHS